MHWIVRNRVWLDRINRKLPPLVTVASVQIGEQCNFHKVSEHLAGPLWRVLLLDATDAALPALHPDVNGAELIMPIPSDPAMQDCKMTEEVWAVCREGASPGGGGG